jgi:hypothetical protein
MRIAKLSVIVAYNTLLVADKLDYVLLIAETKI